MSSQKYCVFTGNPAYHFLIKNMDSVNCEAFGGEMMSTSKYEKGCNDTFSPQGDVIGQTLYKGMGNQVCWYSSSRSDNTVLGALKVKHAKGGLCAVKGSLSDGYVCVGQ